ncbi:hypothetical protein [Acidovorax sp. K2F]|uniref:hypothetical protein n=1 Tax=Acidovorax sp. K2F TaxID=2978125 RepID=UPI0021B0CADD|nr:hypothetical protein [Acidovorax sp. K2F]MCT6719462.1 hypothetical protein [Acidovorax sp. K2F]
MPEKFTPGPWVVRHDFKAANGDLCTGVAAAQIGQGAAAVAWPCGTSDEQMLANANLIAKAPELVEELQFLLDEFEELFIKAGGERPFSELMDEYRKHPRVVAARSLIARATRS